MDPTNTPFSARLLGETMAIVVVPPIPADEIGNVVSMTLEIRCKCTRLPFERRVLSAIPAF